MNWYFAVLKKYVSFTGRAGRQEYWMFSLVNIVVYILFSFVDYRIGVFDSNEMLGIASSIYLLAVLLPTLGVTVRRLHDTSRSGWWFLVTFVPLIGGIILIVFAVLDSTPGENEYGPNPKGV